MIINTEVRSIPVTKKGVYFAFRDQGACISLLAIRVYYITCPEVTASFASFPATPTGRELTSIEQSNGVCVANAVEDSPPKYLCKGDGNWYLQGGGCLCKPGYEANTEKQTCNGKIPSSTPPSPTLGKKNNNRERRLSLCLLLRIGTVGSIIIKSRRKREKGARAEL